MDLPGLIIFGLMAVLVIGSAVGMLLSRRAIYAALFLVLNFGCVAVLYILMGAPFIALAQMTVYAGAIMILFLFVIMLLGTEALPDAREHRWHRLAAGILGLGFLVELVLVAVWKGGSLVPLQPMAAELGSPKSVGLALFRQFALPIEITSLILLVGIIGAIALTSRLHGKEKEFYFLRKITKKPAAAQPETVSPAVESTGKDSDSPDQPGGEED